MLRVTPQIYLALIGSLVGAILAVAAVSIFREELSTFLVEATQRFETVDDFRNAIADGAAVQDLPDESGVSLRSLIQPHPSDEIIYELRPNLRVRFRFVEVTTNSFGMRDEEIELTKPPDLYRLAVLGDSYAFGWGIPQGEAFPDHLERELRQARNVEVLNFGTPGYSTFQEVSQFLERGLRFQPDAVLTYFIHNDFALPFFIRDLRSSSSSSLATAFDFSQMNIPDSDKATLERRANLLRSLDANRSLLTLAKRCHELGIKVFLTVHPDHREATVWPKLWVLKNSPGRELLQPIHLGDEYRRSISSMEIDHTKLTLPNDSHPGPEVHRIVGLTLARLLAPLL